MKRRLRLAAVLAGVLFLVSYSQGAIRDMTHDELISTVGSEKHCVVYQNQQNNPGCEDCALLWCTDTCWLHQDERCEECPPQNCTGHSSYQAFSKTCNICSISFFGACPPPRSLEAPCEDEGDENEGDTVYMCY